MAAMHAHASRLESFDGPGRLRNNRPVNIPFGPRKIPVSPV